MSQLPDAVDRSRKKPRRQPPPLTYGGEVLEGEEVFLEYPDSAGLLLWKSLRSVTLWAELAPEERREAFLPGAYAHRLQELGTVAWDPEIDDALRELAQVLSPDGADSGRVAEAARRIAAWAKARSANGSALAFMQAAALVQPESAELALEVGHLARRRVDFGRAESWYVQAVHVARRAGDWRTYGLAFLAVAIVHLHRGNLPAARKSTLRTLRSARRRTQRDLEGLAQHGLAEIAIRSDDAKAATLHAGRALALLPADHPRLPALAHDVAYLWMSRGYFGAALRVFGALEPAFTHAKDRLYLRANTARAAGGASDREAFELAWADAEQLVLDPVAAQGVSGALLEMARGAASLGEWERAHGAAHRAYELAQERGEGEVQLAAESLLASLRGERAARRRVGPLGKHAPRQVHELAEDLVERLQPAAGR